MTGAVTCKQMWCLSLHHLLDRLTGVCSTTRQTSQSWLLSFVFSRSQTGEGVRSKRSSVVIRCCLDTSRAGDGNHQEDLMCKVCKVGMCVCTVRALGYEWSDCSVSMGCQRDVRPMVGTEYAAYIYLHQIIMRRIMSALHGLFHEAFILTGLSSNPDRTLRRGPTRFKC